MSEALIGTVDTGLFVLYASEGKTTDDVARAATSVLDLENETSLLSRVQRWKRVRSLEKNVVIVYGPEYEEDDGFGGSTTGLIPMGANLAKDVVTILQGKEAN